MMVKKILINPTYTIKINKKKNIGPKIFCDDSIASKSKLPNVKANIDSAAPTNPERIITMFYQDSQIMLTNNNNGFIRTAKLY
jgi:hypothetical protein